MAFTAQDVKKLREMTNVGMMDCKKALVENDGDMDKAVEWLREKGLAKAAKKAGRIAAEGIYREAKKEEFECIDDLQERSKCGKSVIELLEKFGCLKGMTKSNQLSFF